MLPDIQGLTTFELIEIFRVLIANPTHLTAMMLWGLTGTGKSQIVRQILTILSGGQQTWKPTKGIVAAGALELFGEWGLVDLRVSLLEPTDLLGLPDLNKTTTRWVAPSELPIVGQEARFTSRGVLLLDELTHAQPTMQNACYSLLLDRRVGPHLLLPGWKIVAASNYDSENVNTYPMSAPLRSRLEHYHLRCTLGAFKQWGYANGVDPRILAFLSWNPDYLHKPTDNPDQAFPTPRNWANASQLLKMFEGHADLETVFAASVGPGASAMFQGFLDVFSKPELSVDIPSVLRKKAKVPEFSAEQPEIAWAFTSGVAGHVKNDLALLSPAIEFYCAAAWKKVLEIGRTGLADLKFVAGNEAFAENVQPLMNKVHERYGNML